MISIYVILIIQLNSIKKKNPQLESPLNFSLQQLWIRTSVKHYVIIDLFNKCKCDIPLFEKGLILVHGCVQ